MVRDGGRLAVPQDTAKQCTANNCGTNANHPRPTATLCGLTARYRGGVGRVLLERREGRRRSRRWGKGVQGGAPSPPPK